MVADRLKSILLPVLGTVCLAVFLYPLPGLTETFVVRGNTPVETEQPDPQQSDSTFMAIGADHTQAAQAATSDETCFGSECGLTTGGGSRVVSENESRLISELELLRKEEKRITARIKQVEDLLEGKVSAEANKNPEESQKKKDEKAPDQKSEAEDRAAKNYGDVETEELTRLRTKGRAEVLWKGATVVGITVGIRNAGNIEAKGVSAEAVLPDGQRVSLKGPRNIAGYGEEIFIFDQQATVSRGGRVRIDINCENCRN